MLEYPQYTRPADFRGRRVPEVLLGGNHADIAAWRREQSLDLTLTHRPELLATAPLTEDDLALLERLRRAREVEALLSGEGLRCDRLEMRLADEWPKRWFSAFVPEDQRKAAKKLCFSGRRHTGALWQACAMGFIQAISGDAAWPAWLAHAPKEPLLYLPDDRLLYRIAGMPSLALVSRLRHVVLADDTLTQTFLHAPGGQRFFHGIRL